MTSEDQDAVVGRTIRQLRDVKEKLAKLKAHVHSIGDSFSTVAHHLRNHRNFFGFRMRSRMIDLLRAGKNGGLIGEHLNHTFL